MGERPHEHPEDKARLRSDEVLYGFSVIGTDGRRIDPTRIRLTDGEDHEDKLLNVAGRDRGYIRNFVRCEECGTTISGQMMCRCVKDPLRFPFFIHKPVV